MKLNIEREKMMPKMSIVVPIYKVQVGWLRECIDSLINQTLNEIEIILVDDVSPDECGAICDDYAAKDNRVKAIHLCKRGGVSGARNAGIEAATADWIAFVDGDDWVDHDFCEAIYSDAQKADVDILIFNLHINYPQKSFKNPVFYGDYKKFIASDKNTIELQIINKYSSSYKPPFNGAGTVAGKLYKLSYINKNGVRFKPGLTRAEDHLFMLNAMENTSNILYVNKYPYHYRINVNSAVNRYTENVHKTLARTLSEIFLYIERNHKPADYVNAYYARVVAYLFQSIKNDCFHKDNPKPFSVRIRNLEALLKAEPYKSALEKVKKEDLSSRSQILLFMIQRKYLWLFIFLLCKAHLSVKNLRIYK